MYVSRRIREREGRPGIEPEVATYYQTISMYRRQSGQSERGTRGTGQRGTGQGARGD